jgi:putative endonuclease
MPTQKRETGNTGERYTADLIEKMGMRVLERNFTSRTGEIDLIARHDGCVCFIEVKTRRDGGMVAGELAVTTAKKRKIIKTALYWMMMHKNQLQPRFDVCVVTADKEGRPVSHEYYEAAFDGSAYR